MVHFNEKFKVENVDFLKFQRVTKSTQSSIDFTHFAGNSKKTVKNPWKTFDNLQVSNEQQHLRNRNKGLAIRANRICLWQQQNG